MTLSTAGPAPTSLRAAASGPSEDSQLGPVATWSGQAFIAGTLVHTFAVLFDRLPSTTPLPLIGLASLCLLLAPRSVRRGISLSLPLLALFAWMVLSWIWAADADATAARIWLVVPSLLATIAVTGVLPRSPLHAAVRWSIRLTLLLVVVTLLTSPASRASGSDEFFVAGWRGTFPDKNSLALFLVFALSATLSLDRGVFRWVTAAVIAVVVAGTQSATGLSAAVFVAVLWGWLTLLQRRRGRRSALFVLSSVGVGLLASGALLVNATSILDAYGKDASLTGRTEIWAAVARAIQARPFTGYGLGGLLDGSSPSAVTLQLWREIGFEAVHAHNGVLDLLGQLGGVGLVLYLVALGTTVAAAVTRFQTRPHEATFALTMLGAQLVMSVSENVLLGPWLVVLLLVQAGLLRRPD